MENATMTTEAELIVDRRRLKRGLTLWRIAAVVFAVAAIAALAWPKGSIGQFENHIARVKVEGLITGDADTLKLFDDIAASKKVKAVILQIDSPGGTTVGSEAIYEKIRIVAKDKPVVAVMNSVAASGGYITAIAADHILARGNTITGSIGVVFTFPEVSRLLDNLGIKMEEIKSSELKAEPSGFKPVSDKVRQVTQEMVMESYGWFTGLVAERRKMPLEQVKILADGRVYSGRQAVANKLIDGLGGEEQAIAWLETEKKLEKGLKVSDWAPAPVLDPTGFGFSSLASSLLRLFGLETLAQKADAAKLDGLLVLWHPQL
jgi:protease IV